MRPITHSDGHDFPRLIGELVPGIAAVVEDVVVGSEDTIGEPVVSEELPDVLDRIEFGAFRRQRENGDVGRDYQVPGQVPAGLIQEKHGLSLWRDCRGDLGQVQVHGRGVAEGQDEASTLALPGTDGSKNVSRDRALIVWCAGPCAALCPASCDLVLLADPRLVGEPDLYVGGVDALFERDLVQAGAELFLNASIAPSAWEWCRGRAESLR